MFTSESVTCGHPDKLCDSISDAIVDACLSKDPEARVAVETLVKTVDGKGHIVLAGEVSMNGEIPDFESIARDTASAQSDASAAEGSSSNLVISAFGKWSVNLVIALGVYFIARRRLS